MFRFMAFVWDAGDRSQHEAAQRLCTRLQSFSSEWVQVSRVDGLAVFCAGITEFTSRALSLPERAGVVLGALFRRRDVESDASSIGTAVPTASDSRRIIESRGRALIDEYWGRYIAFLFDADSGTRWIVKDPTGRLPCFSMKHQGLMLFCSCFADAVRLHPRAFTIDWELVTYRVALGVNRADRTALAEVTELHGGECLEFRGAEVARHLYWNPQGIVDGNRIEHPLSAARQLRSTARACTRAWSAFYPRILHRLSGGLDSSAVLGCLKQSCLPQALTCVTYYVPGGISDERPWARLAVQSAGCEHIECARERRIDFKDLLGIAPLTTPPAGFSYLEIAPLERQIARSRNVAAVSNGDGGDSLFGRYGTRFAIADYVRHHGVDTHLLSVAADVSMVRNNSVWKVLGDALRNPFSAALVNGVSKERLREGRSLVREDAFERAATQGSQSCHPWFRSGHVSQSTVQRLTLAIQPELFYNPLGRPEDPDPEPLSPLLSQPLVELCLRIPIYVHIEGGRDRGVARRAFAPDVPRGNLTRLWKDSVQGFAEQILMHNMPFIRELLLDGILVRERVLERRRVEQALSGSLSRGMASPGELVDHIATEVWLRSWDGLVSHQVAA